MNHGIDTDTDTTAEVGCIKAAGYSFIARFINRARKAETDHISKMGVYVVSLYETDPTSYEYFSSAQGTHDAGIARDFAHSLGQPLHTPIYFAVDYDASAAEAEANIGAYFAAVNKVLIGSDASIPPLFYVGAYGNGTVLKTLQRNNQAQFTMLAMARLWSGSATYDAWNIKQSHGGKICGINADFNESNGNGGGWRV